MTSAIDDKINELAEVEKRLNDRIARRKDERPLEDLELLIQAERRNLGLAVLPIRVYTRYIKNDGSADARDPDADE